jgi:hypothetical protein
MLEIGTSGLMSGEEKRVVILLLGDLIPRSFSTLPNLGLIACPCSKVSIIKLEEPVAHPGA